MAKIIIGGEEREVKDGEPIKEACKELGVPFGCESGVCGTCRVKVEAGPENLSEKTEAEMDMDMLDDNERLACQCKIKGGEVKLRLP